MAHRSCRSLSQCLGRAKPFRSRTLWLAGDALRTSKDMVQLLFGSRENNIEINGFKISIIWSYQRRSLCLRTCKSFLTCITRQSYCMYITVYDIVYDVAYDVVYDTVEPQYRIRHRIYCIRYRIRYHRWYCKNTHAPLSCAHPSPPIVIKMFPLCCLNCSFD